MNNQLSRRRLLTAGAASAAVLAAPAVHAKPRLQWKLITSWPKDSPGPGITARRLGERIEKLSAGRIRITLYAAGELVPAFGVLDAVGGGTAELGHSAAVFWQGKHPASAYFTAVPFGLLPTEHCAWIYHGGGQALWDELYTRFQVKPFMAGNTGINLGGWYRHPLHSLDDIKGLKFRMPGLGGEVMRRIGAVPVSLPPGEILPALQSGVIDGTEFTGPWADLALGFYRVAPYYYWPGWHEPNGTGECIVNRQLWQRLPAELQSVIEHACMAENSYALAEANWQDGAALDTLVNDHGVKLRRFPDDIIAALRQATPGVLADVARHDAIAKRIHDSFEAARQRSMRWARVSSEAFLQARTADA